MKQFELKSANKRIILALGAESAGNFSIFKNGKIFFSEDFGDLLIDTNFHEYEHRLNEFLKKEKIKPSVILSDLHPDFRTTSLAQELAKKYKATHIPVQHHHAHVFSAIGDRIIVERGAWSVNRNIIGIACDGTGYAEDGTVWGGEIFSMVKDQGSRIKIERVGHLEKQTLLGGEMAIKEPARMLISILYKMQDTRYKIQKDFVYGFVKKYYSKNEFEVLWNQLDQNFNCFGTSSTARILDAVSVLLGFSKNERLSKHGPVDLLEKNSTSPYSNLKPSIKTSTKLQVASYELLTTPLFEYLIKNLDKDKKRLAATAQKYIADGLMELRHAFIQNTKYEIRNTFFAGGMANNKIISSILEKQGVHTNKKIPRGDAGISFGQVFFYLLADPGH